MSLRPDEIGKYYQSQDYVSHSDTRKGLMNKLYHFGRTIMLKKKYRMVNKEANGKNLLDIGCGTGYFPAFMKEKGFSSCRGGNRSKSQGICRERVRYHGFIHLQTFSTIRLKVNSM